MNLYIDPTLGREKKIFTWLVILSPILKQYASLVPGISIAELLFFMWLLGVLLLKKIQFNIAKTKSLIIFWYIGITLTFLSVFFIGNIDIFEISTRVIRFSFYVLLVILSISFFSLNYALKYLKFISYGVAIYILVQFIFYNFFGVILPFQIGNLPLAGGKTFDEQDMLLLAEKYFYRPSGLFIEPGFAAQFLLIYFIFSLFGKEKNDKVDFKSACIMFLAIIATTSSQGIFLSILTITIWIIIETFKRKNSINFISRILLIPLILIGLFIFQQSDNFERSFDKVVGETTAGSSASFRLYRGFEVFSELPLIHKVIGVGHGNLGNYVLQNNIITKYDPLPLTEQAAGYANGFSLVLLYYGLIGVAILVFIYLQLLINTKNSFRVLVLFQIILSFVAGSIFNISLVFYFPFIYAGYKLNKVKLKEKPL